MKRLVITAALSLLLSAPMAQVAPAWVNAPGGVSIAADAADNLYTAQWDSAPAGDITLTKRNAAGTVLWQAKFDNTDSTRFEVATWVTTDGAGNAIVSGTIRSGFSNPVDVNSVVMKFSPQGQLLWRQVYDLPFDGSSTRRVLADIDNTIYVLGLGTGPAGQVSTIRKFNPDGTLAWTWFDSGLGAPANFKWTPDRHLLVSMRGITGIVNGYAKVDRNGATVWSQGGIQSQWLGDAAGDSAGNSYLIDSQTEFGATGSVLRKLSPGGSLLWQRTQPVAGFRVEVPADQGALVSGFPNSGTAGAAFMRFDASGTELWRNLDADGAGFALLLHAQMKLDPAGNAYLAASTLSQMAVTRVNADGSTGWTGTAAGSNSAALTLGSDGAVYVVGGNTAKFLNGAPPPPPQADLKLTLVDAPDPARIGANLVYTVTLLNQGPSTASNVSVKDTLPSQSTFVSAVASQGSCSGAPALACSLGSLASGASASVVITVKPKVRGSLTNTASASATETDPNTADNAATVTTQVKRR